MVHLPCKKLRMKKICALLLMVTGIGCSKKLQLNFLHEYVIADTLSLHNYPVGGLSGIDFDGGNYYIVVDDAVHPRILKTAIEIKEDTIADVSFLNTILIKRDTSRFFKENVLDLESVFVTENSNIHLVSEGAIKFGVKPSILTVDTLGNFVREISTPPHFHQLEQWTLKHNGTFEGSSKSYDGKGFWVAMESPIVEDGEEPSFVQAKSPVRITYYDNASRNANKEFAYHLEKIDKPAKGTINLNGVTAVLEYEKNKFFVVERMYQSGYGAYGNTIRIFNAVVADKTTDILTIDSLKKQSYIPMKKKLLLDFQSCKEELSDGVIDNIEGISFGPRLKNGNRSLLLIADDNFQKHGKQYNQVILVEIQN